jgi:hypothetical protein
LSAILVRIRRHPPRAGQTPAPLLLRGEAGLKIAAAILIPQGRPPAARDAVA